MLLVFCETRLSNENNSLHNFCGYDMHSNARSTSGGGTVLYIRQNHNTERVHSLTVLRPHLETVFASFKHDKAPYLLGNVYRPPSSDLNRFLTCLEGILYTIS